MFDSDSKDGRDAHTVGTGPLLQVVIPALEDATAGMHMVFGSRLEYRGLDCCWELHAHRYR
jgi:hypothetical protein